MASGKKYPTSHLQKAVAGILRAQKGRLEVTTQQIAEASGVMSRSQLSLILKGTKHIDVEQLDAVCYALGLNLTEVIREAEELTDGRVLKPEWKSRPL